MNGTSVETTAGMVHEGVLHDGPEHLAVQLRAPLSESITAGERVVAVVDAPTREALSAALGTGAEHVEFLDPAEVHRVPAFTVASRWGRLTRNSGRPGARTTVVAQHLVDAAGLGPDHWIRLDAALNVVLDGLPITMLCPFPHDPETLPIVRATHPLLRIDGRRLPNDAVRDPVEIVAEYPPPPPPELGPPTAQLDFRLPDLPALRRLVAGVATRVALDQERVADLVLAVNEIATNSVEHGPGLGVLRLWAGDAGLIAEVHDTGWMTIPFPGMVAPPASGERGRGLWLASELTDVLQVWSEETSGTVIRLRVDL
ncbi:MAG: ATP-binding protein [Pseudonocardia sp.]|nr:ATP-binding protein [Pseudonocardia sp.]